MATTREGDAGVSCAWHSSPRSLTEHRGEQSEAIKILFQIDLSTQGAPAAVDTVEAQELCAAALPNGAFLHLEAILVEKLPTTCSTF